MRNGAAYGTVRAGAVGFIGGEITEPVGGGIFGALIFGFIGGVAGAGGGVLKGAAIAAGCALAGAY
jgi:hypothetical protein